ncbi:MAG: DUF362 domain-containing protein [Abditibacteriota bacterium]|nr:DUF362 domain-containing protein [Abditibacteriota bacterium]
MSHIYFADARLKKLSPDYSLPAKFIRMLDKLELPDRFDGKRVAIKVHLGGHLGYTTIPVLFMGILVRKIKEAGGRPFVCDGGSAVPTAKDRGYTEETLGCPVISAQGATENYYKSVPIGYGCLDTAELCGEIVNADAMVVFSHGKGHGMCGFGGAIKNIGMGNVSYQTRGKIHRLQEAEVTWDADKCSHCKFCQTNCPAGAISFDDKDVLHLDLHSCRYCMHCTLSCPTKAIKVGEESMRAFQSGMARVTKACLDEFEPGRVLFINFMRDITPFCDCWGFSSPSLVPDIGIFAGEDIVSVETASIDSIKYENFIPSSLPEQLTLQDKDCHLMEKIHGKNPYLQCEEAQALGLGEMTYDTEIVE